MKKLAVCTAAVALVLAFAATQISTASTNGATASRSSTVVIDHFKYMPSTLRVATGTTVVFSNTSRVSHTATAKGLFDTGKIKPGHAAGLRFERKGTYSYVCTIHPKMHGKIIVG
jgi:plastocyanin